MLVQISPKVWVNPDHIQSIDILCKSDIYNNDSIYWYAQIIFSDNRTYKSSAFKNIDDAIEHTNNIVNRINNKK